MKETDYEHGMGLCEESIWFRGPSMAHQNDGRTLIARLDMSWSYMDSLPQLNYKTGTDWNWDVMGKESDEYLVGGLEPRPLYAVLSQLTHANFYQRALENTSFCSC